MIWIVGSQVEAQVVAMEAGLRDASWKRLSKPYQLLSVVEPTVVFLESSLDWSPLRVRAMTDMTRSARAHVYTEQQLLAGKVPL